MINLNRNNSQIRWAKDAHEYITPEDAFMIGDIVRLVNSNYVQYGTIDFDYTNRPHESEIAEKIDPLIPIIGLSVRDGDTLDVVVYVDDSKNYPSGDLLLRDLRSHITEMKEGIIDIIDGTALDARLKGQGIFYFGFLQVNAIGKYFHSKAVAPLYCVSNYYRDSPVEHDKILMLVTKHMKEF